MLPEPSQLQLQYYPQPILRIKAQPVEAVDEQIRALADRMLALMAEHDGIGLAAQQVGLTVRMFVADVPLDPEAPPPPAPAEGTEPVLTSTTGPEVYINPVIEFLDRQVTPFNEGCLSLPDVRGDVLRPETVRITALDRDGKTFTRVGAGLLARCWQHESDHLDGVLIIDKMNPGDLRSNKRKLAAMER